MKEELLVCVITIPESSRYPKGLDLLTMGTFKLVTVVSFSKKSNSDELKAIKLNSNLYRATIGRDISLGEIGCAYGHFSAYEALLSSNLNHALILEDDAQMVRKIDEVISEFKQIKKPAIVSLINRRGGTTGCLSQSSSLYIRMISPSQGTSAYLINRGAALAYHNNYLRNGVTSTADWHYPLPREIQHFIISEPAFHHDFNSLDSFLKVDRSQSIVITDFDRFSIVRQIRRFKTLYSYSFQLVELLYVEIWIKARVNLIALLSRLHDILKKLSKFFFYRW